MSRRRDSASVSSFVERRSTIWEVFDVDGGMGRPHTDPVHGRTDTPNGRPRTTVVDVRGEARRPTR